MILLTAILTAPLRLIAEETAEDVPSEIAQLVIDHRRLDQFFHPEVPGRVPLVVSDHLLSASSPLSKFDQPVVVKPDSDLTTGPFLRFEDFSLVSDIAILRVSYPVEGVVGRFILTRRGKWWTVRVADVWER